jgi:hypothetical protein
MNMRKIVLAVLFLGSFCFGVADGLAQCTCAPTYQNIAAQAEFKLADVVFVGKVIEIKNSPPDKATGSYIEVVKFEVTRAWKQDLENLLTITNKVQGCINGFDENEDWLVYAYRHQDGTLGTHCCCSRTQLLSRAAKDLNEFKKNRKPRKILEPEGQIGVPMQGRVLYQDGLTRGGARVVVESVCTNTNVHLGEDTRTGSDDSFSLKSFDPNCNRYRFSASHREAFWLPTGDNVFYVVPNGTTPLIELKPGQVPAPVLIRLEQQGGEVEIRAFDEATRSNIYAGLSIHREPVGKRTFGGNISIATADDGSSHPLFLPPGNYVAAVEGFRCHGKAYFSAKPPTFRFTIVGGVRDALTLRVNVAELLAQSSYDNPKAERCAP